MIEELNRRWERRMESQERLFQECYDELLRECERLRAENERLREAGGCAGREDRAIQRLSGILHSIGVLCAEFEAECARLPGPLRERLARAMKGVFRDMEALSKILRGGGGDGGIQVPEEISRPQKAGGRRAAQGA